MCGFTLLQHTAVQDKSIIAGTCCLGAGLFLSRAKRLDDAASIIPLQSRCARIGQQQALTTLPSLSAASGSSSIYLAIRRKRAPLSLSSRAGALVLRYRRPREMVHRHGPFPATGLGPPPIGRDEEQCILLACCAAADDSERGWEEVLEQRRCGRLGSNLATAVRPPEQLVHWRVVREIPGRTSHMVEGRVPKVGLYPLPTTEPHTRGGFCPSPLSPSCGVWRLGWPRESHETPLNSFMEYGNPFERDRAISAHMSHERERGWPTELVRAVRGEGRCMMPKNRAAWPRHGSPRSFQQHNTTATTTTSRHHQEA